MASLASINIRFAVDLREFSTEMQNSLRTIDRVGQKFQAVGRSMSAFVTLPILAAGAAAVKFATDYEESVNKVNVAFGPASDSVKNFAKDSLTAFGIAEGTALDMAATYGDMATSMGLTTTQAAKMSTELVGLAGDLASFKNISVDVANTAITSIFSGETESLKKLGIVMTEVNLQAFALSQGITKQYKDFSQAEKVQIRYAYVMNASKNSIGDFARTGGGAANQMRIFQESLKQIAQQFGSIILPLFTKAITYANGMITSFGNLSEGTKTLIIVMAGVAAAIGPVLSAIGGLIAFIPNLVVKFTALQALILANPYTALAVALVAVGAGIYAFTQNTQQAVTATTALNDAVKKGNQAAAAEVTTLDKLFASATNVKLSIDERKKAVDDLQSLYPAYFKNIKDETILNGQAKTSYEELREAIFNKSRATAIDSEIQSRANERVKDEIKLRENIANTEAEIARLRKGANVIVLQEASAQDKTARITITKNELIAAQTKLLGIQNKELAKFTQDALKADEALFKAKDEYSKKTGKLQENEAAKLGDIKIGTDAIVSANEKLIKSGTVAFFEKQISDLQKLQTEQATTNEAWLQYQRNIDVVKVKIDALTNTKVNLPRPDVPSFDGVDVTPPAFSVGNLEEQKAYFEGQRALFATTSDEYKAYTDIINNTQLKINEITGVEEVKTQLTDLSAKMQYMQEVGAAVGASVADVFSGLTNSLLDSFGLAKNGFEGFIGGLIQTVTKLIAMMLASAISQSIAGAAASGTATGPAAIFTTPAFIATAVGGVLAAFAAIPKFETGGIVGGNSMYGDKILARVNSGELILNNKQQKAVYASMNSAVTASDVAVQIMGDLSVRGDELKLLLARTDKRDKRVK